LASALMVGACDTDDGGEDSQRFRVTIEHVGTPYPLYESGAFDTPVGAASPAPIFPGESYEFTVHAAPGHRLSFATMMVQSNDLFYAPAGEGIALHDEAGDPVSGDVTGEIQLWDAGTEVNQEPGSGADQAPRQAGPDTGAADPDDLVRMADDDFGNLPAVAEVLSVEISHEGDDRFLVTVTNVSDASTLSHSGGASAVPLSPGVWAVHPDPDPLFSAGTADAGDGLEALAEDGDPSVLAATLAGRTGLSSPFAPGVWAVSAASGVLFEEGTADRGEGLEALAEDGDPSVLSSSLSEIPGGVFNTPEGASETGPLLPGASYSFELEAARGDRLFFATMLVQSNDLFVGPGQEGIALFDADGMALSGEVSSSLALWDAGTEVNQRPGTGSDQPLRQAGPDTGAGEGGSVHRVDDGFDYPAAEALLRVTVTPIQ
jgi:hypothetical protein